MLTERERLQARSRRHPNRVALVIATAYLILGTLWIGILEAALPGFVPSPALTEALQSIGLLGFVLGTGVALFFVIRLELRRRDREGELVAEELDRLRVQLDVSPLARIEWSRDLRVTAWSETAAELFGWPEAQALGQSALDWEILDPASRAEFERALSRIRLSDAAGVLQVLKNRSQSGDAIWCEWSIGWARSAKSGEGTYLTLVRDVTPERRQMEQVQDVNRELELRTARRTRELTLATRELNALTHSVSNDLRAPVRSMIGFAERLRDRFADELSSEARSQLVYLLAAGHQLDHLIQELTEYARLGTASSVALRPVDVAEAVRSALAELEENFPEAPSVVTLPLSTLTLRADPVLLHQVFVNLIENALKYRDSRRPPRIRIEAERSAGEARIRIRDNGVGIPPEHRERVFRLFSRLHSQEMHAGSGMGLAVVRRAMELMGGAASVASQSGPGTTVLLRFPSHGSPDAPSDQPGSSDRPDDMPAEGVGDPHDPDEGTPADARERRTSGSASNE